MGASGNERPDGVDGERLRSIIDALPRALVVTDPAGRIVLWNEVAERLYGWNEDEVRGRSAFEVLAPPERLGENQQWFAARADENFSSSDRMVVRRDGRVVRVLMFTKTVLDAGGRVALIVLASEDVGALREAEQRARDTTAHLSLALGASGMGTWRWDMRTGETVWDERLEALFGLSPGGFDGTFDTYVTLLHPDDREAVLAQVKAAVDTKVPYRVEHRVVWPDGSIRWIAGAGTVILDDSGAVAGTVGCSFDVTDRIVHEHERERLVQVAIDAAEGERLLRERLEFVNTINDAINQSATLRDMMVNVTSTAVPRLGDWCSIHVLTRRGSTIPEVEVAHVDPAMMVYARQLQQQFPYDPNAPTGVAHVIRSGHVLYYPEITDDVVSALEATDEERAIINQLALRSAIAVPLVKKGRILGAMQFVRSDTGRGYTQDDVALAQAVAGRIASSIENHRLNDEQRVIASTLQHSLLPSRLPDVPGLEIAVRYWPSGEQTEVGGDFYDVFALEDGHSFAFVMGDVCGTGPAAAALTGLARHTIRDSAWHGDRPAEVLSALNRAVLRSGTNTFLTAVYCEVHTAGPHLQLTVATGGHPLPVHTMGTGTHTIGTPGTVIGVVDDPSFHPTAVRLEPGDTIVFYTDGATDVRPPYGLDPDQFACVIAAAATAVTAETVADDIHRALEAIIPLNERHDDVALLVLRASPLGR